MDRFVGKTVLVTTEVRQMPNGKKCCFGQDIEGNYLEIIGAR